MKKEKPVKRAKARSTLKGSESVPEHLIGPLIEELEIAEDPQTAKAEAIVAEQLPPFQQLGRNQKMWIDTMLVFADCAVQRNEEAVFHVLARNFEDTGGLNWWLWRIGQGEMSKHLKGKDIVDAVRKVSGELFKHLTGEIGKPVSRL